VTFFLGRVSGSSIFGTIGRSAVPPATTHRAARPVDLVNTLFVNMADDKKEPEEEEELLDYEEEEEAPADAGAKGGDAAVKKGYVGIHSTGFRDFLLKPELLRAIVDCGFEHPSEGTRRSPSGRANRAVAPSACSFSEFWRAIRRRGRNPRLTPAGRHAASRDAIASAEPRRKDGPGASTPSLPRASPAYRPYRDADVSPSPRSRG
jgi:hypothetical protein